MVWAGRKMLTARLAKAGEFEVGGIADGEGSGRDGDGSASTEGERGGRVDAGCASAERSAGCADGERLGAELVGEDNAQARSAKRDVDDLTIGGVDGSIGAGVGGDDG